MGVLCLLLASCIVQIVPQTFWGEILREGMNSCPPRGCSDFPTMSVKQHKHFPDWSISLSRDFRLWPRHQGKHSQPAAASQGSPGTEGSEYFALFCTFFLLCSTRKLHIGIIRSTGSSFRMLDQEFLNFLTTGHRDGQISHRIYFQSES